MRQAKKSCEKHQRASSEPPGRAARSSFVWVTERANGTTWLTFDERTDIGVSACAHTPHALFMASAGVTYVYRWAVGPTRCRWENRFFPPSRRACDPWSKWIELWRAAESCSPLGWRGPACPDPRRRSFYHLRTERTWRYYQYFIWMTTVGIITAREQ